MLYAVLAASDVSGVLVGSCAGCTECDHRTEERMNGY